MIVLVRKPWPGALVESLPPTMPRKEAVSYIIRNHTQRGKFHPERATQLKVEKGQKVVTALRRQQCPKPGRRNHHAGHGARRKQRRRWTGCCRHPGSGLH